MLKALLFQRSSVLEALRKNSTAGDELGVVRGVTLSGTSGVNDCVTGTDDGPTGSGSCATVTQGCITGTDSETGTNCFVTGTGC